MLIEVEAQIDELGELEEFTWDLVFLVDPNKTLHLEGEGLPKIGTKIMPGMVVVGKVGKSALYSNYKRPQSAEFQLYSDDQLTEKYGKYWRDGSLYADSSMVGYVTQSYMKQDGEKK
jgi:DNA-directed RNA polymerase beta subunit